MSNTAHSLKSSSMNVGAAELADMCRNQSSGECGGLLIRAYLQENWIEQMGRVVLVGTREN